MTMPSQYELINVGRDRAAAVREVDSWGFAFTPRVADEPALEEIFNFDRGRGVVVASAEAPASGPDNTTAMHEHGSLAAVHSSIPFTMRLPGGNTVATSGLTWVAVHPAHRRRGLLTAMIHDHFERSLSRGEPISALYASEPAIYQRFGYGLACVASAVELGRTPAFRANPGAADLPVRLESASIGHHAAVVTAVQARMSRPATMTSVDDVTMRDLFMDLEGDRHGAERLRIAIVEDDEGPAAYALFSRKITWEDGNADGVASVATWGSAHGPATQRLFGVLTDLDLMSKTKVGGLSADDALMRSLVDVRQLRAKAYDNLWVRILDVPAALEASTYSADCDVTIEITDTHLSANAGAWRVSIADGKAAVTRAERDSPIDLQCSIQDLAAAYLGGVTVTSLADAGLVREVRTGTLAPFSAAMRGDQLPVSNIGF